MITIFHGENIGESRKALNSALDLLKEKGVEIVYLEGAKVTQSDLANALESSSLFFTQALVIEGLLSRMRSKIKDGLIKYLADYQGDKNIFLWDSKEVTKPNLTPFGKGAKIVAFKTPAVIFQLLETLNPNNFHACHSLLSKCVDSLDPGFIFVMLARHISNLLIAKSGDSSKLIPFTRGRLTSQATLWSEKELTRFHSELLRVDRLIKTGNTKLDYISQLDLVLANLLN